MLSTDACQYLQETSEIQSVEPELETIEQPPHAAPLSGKQRRALLKRDRRRRKRQALAKLRLSVDQSEIDQDHNDDDDNDDDAVKEDEEERQRLHLEWLERERIAQEEFRLKQEKEEAARRKKEEEEKRIKEEWEEQQRKEREEQEQKEQKKRDREEAVQKMLDQAESQLENGGSWKNPDAPVDYGTEKDRANCPFFLKTGACRFGDRCCRKHEHPISSSTLMIRAMFVTFGMEQIKRDDYDTDASLEYSEEEVYQQFVDFYEDVLPEFRNAGKVVQFKVSCNFEPHLRGNVYVQYNTEDQCKEAFIMFNGRWYAGKQLQCEFCPVTRWKSAICGLFDRQKCPKGKHCNFLHVFRNPGNAFWEADRDLHLSPDRTGGFTGRHSERRDKMSQRSYIPERSHRRRNERRSHSRERYSYRRRRSNSRERRSRSRSRESRRSQHSLRRGQGSFSERYRRSRSRDRCRSRSRGRDGGHHSLPDSRKRSSRRSESDSPGEESKNGSVKRKSRKSGSKSPDGCVDATTDAMSSSRHHKRSKKSKKKKKGKKKQKRKRSRSSSGSSSAGSGKETEENDEEDEGLVKNQDTQSTETPGDEHKTAEPTKALQEDNAENHSSDSCQIEDESLPKPEVTTANTDTDPKS